MSRTSISIAVVLGVAALSAGIIWFAYSYYNNQQQNQLLAQDNAMTRLLLEADSLYKDNKILWQSFKQEIEKNELLPLAVSQEEQLDKEYSLIARLHKHNQQNTQIPATEREALVIQIQQEVFKFKTLLQHQQVVLDSLRTENEKFKNPPIVPIDIDSISKIQ